MTEPHGHEDQAHPQGGRHGIPQQLGRAFPEPDGCDIKETGDTGKYGADDEQERFYGIRPDLAEAGAEEWGERPGPQGEDKGDKALDDHPGNEHRALLFCGDMTDLRQEQGADSQSPDCVHEGGRSDDGGGVSHVVGRERASRGGPVGDPQQQGHPLGHRHVHEATQQSRARSHLSKLCDPRKRLDRCRWVGTLGAPGLALGSRKVPADCRRPPGIGCFPCPAMVSASSASTRRAFIPSVPATRALASRALGSIASCSPGGSLTKSPVGRLAHRRRAPRGMDVPTRRTAKRPLDLLQEGSDCAVWTGRRLNSISSRRGLANPARMAGVIVSARSPLITGFRESSSIWIAR